MSEKKRPGVMFYFEMRPCLKRLSMQEKGLLFEMMLDYAEFGECPEPEGVLGVAWDFIQPRIDRDGERYEEIRQARRLAAQKRWGSQQEEPQEGVQQEDANAELALQTMPTTTPTSTTNTTTISTPSSTSSPAAAASPLPAQGQALRAKHSKTSEMEFEDLRSKKMRALAGMISCAQGQYPKQESPPSGWDGGLGERNFYSAS